MSSLYDLSNVILNTLICEREYKIFVTQSLFVLIANKFITLFTRMNLCGWLFAFSEEVTCFLVTNQILKQARRIVAFPQITPLKSPDIHCTKHVK